jgi:hypothetical protein
MPTKELKKPKVNSYAPYWENDQVANPVLVRYAGHNDGEWFDVILPDGTERQVHCHTLGVFRKA